MARRMEMHPHGERLLAAMPDGREREITEIAETVGKKIAEIRNGIDWLFTNGYISKRKNPDTGLNAYANKAFASECKKAKHRRWV